jgi:hypothetical protein
MQFPLRLALQPQQHKADDGNVAGVNDLADMAQARAKQEQRRSSHLCDSKAEVATERQETYGGVAQAGKANSRLERTTLPLYKARTHLSEEGMQDEVVKQADPIENSRK